MEIQTVGVLYPGAMGASLARTLSTRVPHLTLLTSVSGRSASTLARAEAAGLVHVPMAELVSRADILLSILPPSAALDLAKETVSHLPQRAAGDAAQSGRTQPLIYADINAVSPGTTAGISALLVKHGVVFLDGAVIGFPATETSDPKVYLSCADEYEAVLRSVATCLSGGADGKGLKIRAMHGAGEGAASALKMCYGGISKGSIGLAALLVLAANAHSKGTADALLDEYAESKPAILAGLSRSFPDMIGKAYRWVGEMEEISSFIHASLATDSSATSSKRENGAKAAETFQGLANVFARIADDMRVGAERQERASHPGDEVESLLDWARRGGRAVARKSA